LKGSLFVMKIKKIISMTLTFALLMSIMVSAEPKYDGADENFPRTTLRLDEIPEVIDPNVIRDSNHVARLYELESDLSSVVFSNDDNTNTLYMFGEEIKYIDEDGAVRDKSNRLYEVSDSETYAFYNRENDIRTYFPRTLGVQAGVMLTGGDVNIELSPITEVAATAVNRHDNYVYYDEVFGRGTAVRYTPMFDGFKEDVVLSENVGNEFRFLLNPNGMRAEITEIGSVDLLDPMTGESAVSISPVYVYDSDGNSTYDNEIRLVALDCGSYELVLVACAEFLACERTVYPVYVDPTVTINVSGSGANKTIQDLPIVRNTNGTVRTLPNDVTTVLGAERTLDVQRYLIRLPGVMTALDNIAAIDIINATLHMTHVGSPTSMLVGAYQYDGTINWTETSSTVTWSNATTLINRISTPASQGNTSVLNFNITSAVTAWKTNQNAAERGLLLRNDSSETNTSMRATFFTTRQIAATGHRPYATVRYNSAALSNFPNHIGNTFGTNPKTTRIITWQTASAVTSGEVRITQPVQRTIAASTITVGARSYFRAEVTGLVAGTTYSYRCGNNTNGLSEVYTFTTEAATMPTNGFTILHVTDPHVSNSDISTAQSWQRTIQAGINRVPNPAFVVNTGDVTDNRNFNELNFYFDYAQDIKARNAFVYSLGNNDRTEWYNRYFATAGTLDNTHSCNLDIARCECPRNYSFVYGNTLFISVHFEERNNNINTSTNSWLATQLDRKRTTPSIDFTVVMLHESPYGNHIPDCSFFTVDRGTKRRNLANLFSIHNVDLVLGGHNHFRARTNPISTVNGRGTIYSIPNTAGNKFNPRVGTLLSSSNTNNQPCCQRNNPPHLAAAVNAQPSHSVSGTQATLLPTAQQTQMFSEINIRSNRIELRTYTVNASGASALHDTHTIFR
jgi:predicted phosphodiesterase